ncbi:MULTISPECIES: putative sporulation protein YtxC [unclassified Paenibacillus]|uniref:putative sporulation protein YtxC n=1 Tax=unclassified Paenibacillus TaxID=185978 RepID=UPI001AEAE202|nr:MULTISPECIES: putative sporulation protein YtxC [unclassified Paenibacillus]MBP1156770.1 putative sporulation protein YtxC [Paenibacillus sp. PvP091]MBP1172491.1 putative sporulation protein YtxC [Paenibacillus sp. PvR098]MBP2438872.1 putative sporulation protein YtxC [Paenibacillus sp. PvP052]
MKLLTVTLTKRTDEQADRLYRLLQFSGGILHNKEHIHIALDRRDGLHQIKVSGVAPAFRLEEDGIRLYKEAAEVLADYLLEEEEPEMLRKMIKHDFHYHQVDEVEGIMAFCGQTLCGEGQWCEGNGKTAAYLRRKQQITAELYEYLEKHEELNLDGLVRFRLQAYRGELRDVVEYAIDEFVMDQQYQEFISLLQYFVYIQEAKIPFVHLIHKGGSEFMLLNERMETLNTDETDAVVTVEMLEKEMNFEDMIVSTLITVSPQQIYIHTREPELQVIKTITQIFEDRVELCGYCRLCHNLDRGAAAEYNKG